jgi:DNA-binding XRE family transcriptional regulator
MNLTLQEVIIPAQIRAARGLVGATQAQVASLAGVSKTALVNIETGKSDPKASTLKAIQAALESLGAVFIDDDNEPGVKLRRPPST